MHMMCKQQYLRRENVKKSAYRSSKAFQIMCVPSIGRLPVISHSYEVYYCFY